MSKNRFLLDQSTKKHFNLLVEYELPQNISREVKKYKININKKPYKGTYGFFYLFSVYNFKPKLRGLFDVLRPLNIITLRMI